MKAILSLSILIFGMLFQVSAQDLRKIIKPEPSVGNKVQPQLILLDSLETKYAVGLDSNLERNTLNPVTKLPYPIIFVHGLNSSRSTWNDTKNLLTTSFGLTDGGYFDVNLNYDDSLLSSNKTNDSHLYYSSTNAVSGGDLYFVNFAVNTGGIVYVNPNGSVYENCLNLSNQSAITKQGYILKDIIMNVMQLTGKTKVVLMGHSMGGLASREYLQNPENWQIDGFPHVAKLATTGTPHGGSNAIGGQILNVNYDSEAIRDLKKTSVFLEGGYETWVASNYYNSDVNCNGVNNDGLYVIGLNQRDIFSDIDYSCVIGTGLSILGVGGDGAVTIDSANLNNANSAYANLTQNVFSVFKTHNLLTNDWYTIMQALDEPNDFGKAYGVTLNNASVYYGFNSAQSSLYTYYTTDYDDYKFSVTGNSNVNFTINKPAALNLNARLMSNNLSQLGPIFSNNGGGTISFYANNLPQGDYYLEIYGTPTANTISQYNFSLSSTLSNSDFIYSNSLNVYPNPTSSLLYFDNSTQKYEMAIIKNNLGQIISQIRFDNFNTNQEIDLSNYSRGMYMITFTNKDNTITKKVILE